MSEDTDVMFRLGVMDHPGSKAALESLAKGVESAQARMTAGVEAIGQTATKVGSLVDSLSSKLDEMQAKQSSAMRGVVPDSVQPMGPQKSSSSGSATPSFDGADEAAAAASDRIQSRLNGIDLSDMSKSMQNVFTSLGTSAGDAADEIIEQMERSIAGLVQLPTAQAELVKAQYQEMMVESSAAYAEMTADLDSYTAKHGSATERIGANLKRGEANLQRYRDSASSSAQESSKMFVESALHVAQMAKGLATIGLVSEENAQKFMQSLAVIQGTFDVLKGGIEAYEKFGKGMRLARDAQQALTKAQTVASAVETAQLVQVRAYHAALVQETVAANAAAGANGRLAAARAAAGASGAAAAAGSAASGAGAVGAGMLGRFGGMLGRVGAAAGSPVALAGIAAAAGVGASGTAIYQSATGSATRSDSTIAGLEARVAAWTLRLTGLFESTDAPMVKFSQSLSSYADGILDMIPGGDMLKSMNVVGDIAGLAASQAGVERGQKSLDQNRITNDGQREISAARLEADREKARFSFGNMADATRSRAEAETQRFGFRDLAGDREAERTNLFNRHKMRSVKDEGALGAAMVMELGGNAARMRARPQEADTQLKGETQVYAQAVSDYAKAKSELDKTLSFAGSSEADRENAMKNATFYQDKMLDSLSRQAQLARSSGAERLNIEREIQSAALAAIDQQQSKLDALNDRRKSAMRSFVDMDAIERSMATKALKKARAGGGALSKMETDLLGRIGTSETERFVDQSTAVKAKQMGFDATFGQSMDMERRQIEGTRQQLEGQLQASFDVSMQVEANTDAVVDAILPRAEKAIEEMAKAIERSFDEKLRDKLGEMQTQMSRNNIMLRKN